MRFSDARVKSLLNAGERRMVHQLLLSSQLRHRTANLGVTDGPGRPEVSSHVFNDGSHVPHGVAENVDSLQRLMIYLLIEGIPNHQVHDANLCRILSNTID